MANLAEDVIAFAESNLVNLVIIDERRLERECFVRSLEVTHPNIGVLAFAKTSDWIEQMGKSEPPLAVLYSTLGRRIAEEPVADEIVSLEKASRPVPIIVLSPFEDLTEMIAALDCGASGFIPACLGIDAMLTAVRLSAEGAVFLTAGSILAMRGAIETQKAPSDIGVLKELGLTEEQLTPRQAAVADRLRRGKPNKLIAYELNMCESTVKVHIRTIMKKLRATNRTEAGFKLNAMVAETERGSARSASVGMTAASLGHEGNGSEASLLSAAAYHRSSATAPARG